MPADRARRLTILNLFYAPDISPTAQLAAALAEHRAERGDDVTVICGRSGYADASGLAPSDGAVQVVRSWSLSFGRRSVLARAADYTTYVLGALVRILTLPAQDVVVSLTTPPFLVTLGLLHRIRHRRARVVLWSMDVYPEAAIRLGVIGRRSPVARVLSRVNRALLRRADEVVALDGAMADLLRESGARSVRVVPNWERADLFGGAPARPWDGYRELGVADDFVVLYLGNAGRGHRFDTVLRAMARVEGVALVFVGGGPRWPELKAAAVPGVRFHDYVDKDETPAVLAGAGASLICLDDAALGVMSPSKLHSCLASGTPVLYVGPAGSNVAEAVDRFGCGVRIDHGDVDGLVAAIERLRDGEDERSAMAAAARTAFETAYDGSASLAAFDRLIDDLAPAVAQTTS